MQGNAQQLKGSWNEMLGKVKAKWGELTDDDLRIAEGNIDQLIGRIQNKTGQGREAIMKAVNEFSQNATPYAERATRAVGEVADQMAGRFREGSEYVREHAGEGYDQARQWVSDRPVQSVAVIFGLGVGLGLLFGLTMRQR